MAMGYELDDRGSIPCKGRRFLLHYSFQTGSGAHPASFTIGTVRLFPEG
jgi:hypothetical protein